MIFVAYSIPVLIIVVARLLGTGISRAEITFMLIAVLLYNRIPFVIGGPACTIDDIVRFYGGWWSRVDAVTLSRTLEMCGYIMLISVLRLVGGVRWWKGREGSLDGSSSV